MFNLVTIDQEGHLRRYLCGPGKPYLTHEADVSEDAVAPLAAIVDSFRRSPPEDFRVGPVATPPSPGGDAA